MRGEGAVGVALGVFAAETEEEAEEDEGEDYEAAKDDAYYGAGGDDVGAIAAACACA